MTADPSTVASSGLPRVAQQSLLTAHLLFFSQRGGFLAGFEVGCHWRTHSWHG